MSHTAEGRRGKKVKFDQGWGAANGQLGAEVLRLHVVRVEKVSFPPTQRHGCKAREGICSCSRCDSPEMLMSVVSILPPLVGTKLSMKVGPPLRLILERLTFTNSRLMLRESFLPVTEDGSSSTVPCGVRREKIIQQ